MKTLTTHCLVCFALLISCISNAQIDFLSPSDPIFTNVTNGSFAFADIDNDNDQDVLITGVSGIDNTAYLYINNGNGIFSLSEGTPFDGVFSSSVAFADIDGDNDLDVLITGDKQFYPDELYPSQPSADLFINDGYGNFSLVIGTPFIGVKNSSIAFEDIDGDNDQDVLITGESNNGQKVAKLYTNNGNGNFTLTNGTPFDGVSDSSIAFGDVNGDSFPDLLITGKNNGFEKITKLYTNDGSGNFTLIPNTTFDGVFYSSTAFADIDGDNDLDVLITGHNGTEEIAKLYTNNGFGSFSLVSGTVFTGVSDSSIAFADIDNDNDQDVLITGEYNYPNLIANLYLNDGEGNFSLNTTAPFEGINESSIGFEDIDGDNDLDVLITGSKNQHRISELFINDGYGNYSPYSPTFEGVYFSSIDFADVDNDNDQDLLITGGTNSVERIANLYINNGNGIYSLDQEQPFVGVVHSSVVFEDIDNDNDQDLLITGYAFPGYTNTTSLYTNDGYGNFSLVEGTPFEAVHDSSIAFADIDGDNDKDVFITGHNGSEPIAKLYSNDGIGNFTLIPNTPFEGVSTSSVAFEDIDGDNDQDLLVVGHNVGQYSAKLYINNGFGDFSLVPGTLFEPVISCSLAFIDIDNDNDKDVIIVGHDGWTGSAKLYTNNGLGIFTLVENTPFIGVFQSSIAIADIDGDTLQDILISGGQAGPNTTNLYHNDGNGNFSLVQGMPFVGVRWGSIGIQDVNGDNKPDVLITGLNDNFQAISKLYLNLSQTTLSSPEFTEVNNKDFSVVSWPNPSGISFNLKLDTKNLSDMVSIKVFDLSGKLVHKNQFNPDQIYSFGENLKGGLYIVNLKQGNDIESVPLIKY